MIATRQFMPLFLALTLWAVPTCAQTGQPSPPPKPATAPADAEPAKSPAPQPSASAEKRPGGNEGAQQRSGSGGDSPFDYRASEQISEDLPVSFPADI